MENRKMILMNLIAGQQWRCRHREYTCGQNGEGEVGTNWESSIETCIFTIHKAESLWKFALWHRELKPGALWQPREMGWGGYIK